MDSVQRPKENMILKLCQNLVRCTAANKMWPRFASGSFHFWISFIQSQQPYFSSILGFLLGRLSCRGFWTIWRSNQHDILVHHSRVHKATDEAAIVVLHFFPDHVGCICIDVYPPERNSAATCRLLCSARLENLRLQHIEANACHVDDSMLDILGRSFGDNLCHCICAWDQAKLFSFELL